MQGQVVAIVANVERCDLAGIRSKWEVCDIEVDIITLQLENRAQISYCGYFRTNSWDSGAYIAREVGACTLLLETYEMPEC